MCGPRAGSGLAEELDMDPPRLRGIKTRGRRVLRIPAVLERRKFYEFASTSTIVYHRNTASPETRTKKIPRLLCTDTRARSPLFPRRETKTREKKDSGETPKSRRVEKCTRSYSGLGAGYNVLGVWQHFRRDARRRPADSQGHGVIEGGFRAVYNL